MGSGQRERAEKRQVQGPGYSPEAAWEGAVPPVRFQLTSVELWKRPLIHDVSPEDDSLSPPQA
jgi:hypothetical protein